MPDQPVTIQLQTTSTTKGIEVLAITAGIGNGWNFKPEVLQASLSLWDRAECYTDHTPDKHSVRDLGGVLSDPQTEKIFIVGKDIDKLVKGWCSFQIVVKYV
jgi:hypothetical protein